MLTARSQKHYQVIQCFGSSIFQYRTQLLGQLVGSNRHKTHHHHAQVPFASAYRYHTPLFPSVLAITNPGMTILLAPDLILPLSGFDAQSFLYPVRVPRILSRITSFLMCILTFLLPSFIINLFATALASAMLFQFLPNTIPTLINTSTILGPVILLYA